MAKIHRSARGDAVDIDMVRLANESTIAIGNMRTNARGDQLGAGGKVVKTRSQVMQEYHKLNTSVPHDIPIGLADADTLAVEQSQKTSQSHNLQQLRNMLNHAAVLQNLWLNKQK